MLDKSLIEDTTIGALMSTNSTTDIEEKYAGFKPNMSLAVLRRSELITEWLGSYSKATRLTYLSHWNILCDKSGKSTEELYKLDDKEFKRTVKAALGALVVQGKTFTAKNVLTAAKSFAAHFEKNIKFAHSERIRTGRKKNQEGLKSYDIYAVAEAASGVSNPRNPRNKALIKTDWIAGLRENAILKLRCGAVLDYKEEDCPIPLKVGNEFQTIGENGLWCIDDKLSGYGVDYYYTFIAKEALVDIQDWLHWRKANIGSYEAKDFLFCRVKAEEHGRPLDINQPPTPQTVWATFKSALDTIGIDRTKTTFHKLRNSFKSTLIKAEVEEEVREVLMGHAPTGSKKNYFDGHDVDMIRTQYAKADWSRVGSNRIDRIEKENQDLRGLVMDMQGKMINIQSSTAQIETLAKILPQLYPQLFAGKGKA